MANPLKGFFGNSNANNPLSQMMQMARGLRGSNPQQMLNNLMQQNPAFRTFMQQMQNTSNGRSPKEMVMQMAKQNGMSEADVMQLYNSIFKNQ